MKYGWLGRSEGVALTASGGLGWMINMSHDWEEGMGSRVLAICFEVGVRNGVVEWCGVMRCIVEWLVKCAGVVCSAVWC